MKFITSTVFFLFFLPSIYSQTSLCKYQRTILSDASCEDPNPFDQTFIYEGSEIITLGDPNSSYFEESVTSTFSEINTSITNNGSSNEFLLEYDFSTTITGPLSIGLLIKFWNIPKSQYECVEVLITVDPCSPPDAECVEVWNTKNMSCNRLEDGYAVFDFSMNVAAHGYQLCDGQLLASIEEEGSVLIHQGHITNDRLVFQVEMLLPCNFDRYKIYYLRLFLCDDEGHMVCYEFPFFFSCDIECPQGGPKRIAAPKPSEMDLSFYAYPNPASTVVNMRSASRALTLMRCSVYNISGGRMEVTVVDIGDATWQFDASHLPNGMYLVQMTSSDGTTVYQKIMIIH